MKYAGDYVTEKQRMGVGVGMKMPDGTVKAIFIHHGCTVGRDADYLAPDEVLAQFYTTRESVEELIRHGSLSSIGPEPTVYDSEYNPTGKCHKTEKIKDVSWVTIKDKYKFQSEADFFKNAVGEMGTGYLYIYDDENKSWYSSFDYQHDHSLGAKIKDAIADFIDNFGSKKEEAEEPEIEVKDHSLEDE